MEWYEHPQLQFAFSGIALKLGADPDNIYTPGASVPIYRGAQSNGTEIAEISAGNIETFGYVELGTSKPRLTDWGGVVIKNHNITWTPTNKFTIATWVNGGTRNGAGGGYNAAGNYFWWPWYDGTNTPPRPLSTMKLYCQVNSYTLNFDTTQSREYGIHHICFVKDVLDLKVYYDGVLVGTGSYISDAGTKVVETPYQLGMVYGTTSVSDMDAEVKHYYFGYYKDALSLSEIQAQYAEGHLMGYVAGTSATPMIMSTSTKRDKILLIGDSNCNRFDSYVRGGMPERIISYDPENDIGTDEVIAKYQMDAIQEAQIILFHIAYWDAYREYSAEIYIANMGTIIDSIRAIEPNVKIVIDEGIYTAVAARNAFVVQYNAALPALVASKSNCYLITGLYNLSTTVAYEDQVHIAPSGAATIGAYIVNFLNETFYPEVPVTVDTTIKNTVSLSMGLGL